MEEENFFSIGVVVAAMFMQRLIKIFAFLSLAVKSVALIERDVQLERTKRRRNAMILFQSKNSLLHFLLSSCAHESAK